MTRKEQRLPIQHGQPRTLQSPAKRSKAAPDLSKQVDVTFVLRSRGSEDEWRELVAKLTSGPPAERRYLTHAEFARKWGASPGDIQAVKKFAAAQRLKVVSADPFRRCVVVKGSLRQLSRAFSVDFFAVDHPQGTFHSHDKAPQIPQSIHPLVESVLGLDAVPAAVPHTDAPVQWSGMDRRALLEAYAVPPRLTGKGQCVAIIELGGGYDKRDLVAYFKQFELPPPPVSRRGIDGVKNDPAPPAMMHQFMLDATPQKAAKDPRINMAQVQWTIETMTDIDMVGTIAPEVSILVVQAPNTDPGQFHAVTAVIADRKNAPSALSISWGAPEQHQTSSLMRVLDRWFQAAAVLGITVCCSSGDMGAAPITSKSGKQTLTAQFPASSPSVLACGGTTLHPKRRIEVAWDQTMNGVHMASGGGFSNVFPLPKWQQDAGIDPQNWIPADTGSGKGRAVPDVAARANMQDGYCVIVGGEGVPCGGTSASAPLWAAVVAILNEQLKTRVGSLHAPLYDGSLSKGIRDITAGNTGAFKACKGWDACTGWGSPRVEALVALLGDDNGTQ